MPTLLISVRFHDGRYHGRPEWPPAPARLFQALVAGAARAGVVDEADVRALLWLEALDAPIIAVPHHRETRGFSTYVPNNDLDAKGGDPGRVNEIRAPKLIKPVLFDAKRPLLYLWRFADDPPSGNAAQRICAVADRLYQLGRGIDMAWACAEILEGSAADDLIARHQGAVHAPTGAGAGSALPVPARGSLDSLIARHKHQRFETVYETKPSKKEADRKVASGQLFRQPPKPRFRQIAYDSPPIRLLFDVVGNKAPYTLAGVAAFTEAIRDAAAIKLKERLPAHAAEVHLCLIGRNADESDKARRIRITPLPSIGHRHVTPAIRRVLAEIPSACPLSARDIAWALSGLELVPAEIDAETGEVADQLALAPASDRSMLQHYGIEGAAPERVWRTVTPVALPVARRRIDPSRVQEAQTRAAEGKRGGERETEDRRAAGAVLEALRHAGVRGEVASVRVQREPFSAQGKRAEAFAYRRFEKERLWHVELSFCQPQRGPLIIGDGRYLGLGLMQISRAQLDGVMAFSIEKGLAPGADPLSVARALRRAVLARVQVLLGERQPLPLFFTGHSEDGAAARSGEHEHLSFVCDASHTRLLLIAPHILEHRKPRRWEPREWARLEQAMEGFAELRAAASGILRLRRSAINAESDPLFAAALSWESAASYRATRHHKLSDASLAISTDIAGECRRLNLPDTRIEVTQVRSAPGSGLSGQARLQFRNAVRGPILLGRDRHFGGGLFASGGNSAT